jgi:thiamine biosynthesis lipoprotein
MGNRFELGVLDHDEKLANEIIDAGVEEIRRIENLLTTYKEDSETSLANRNAGIAPVEVSSETLEIIERSIRISNLTQGAFDISYGSVDKRLWNFDITMKALPDKATAKKMVRLINYRNIVIDKKKGTVFLRKKGMRIGFGGIGKGYAAERAKMVMKSKGSKSGIVNASGDLTTWGLQPNGKEWTIGVTNPNLADQVFSYLDISNMSIATSGNYEKYVLIGGKRYSHTIDPRTGLPVSGIKSVTIITTNAEIADAMTTPVMIMGKKAGLDMINQITGMEAILVDDFDRVYASRNIRFSKAIKS